MTDNEARLIQMIRNSSDPVAAIRVATAVILDCAAPSQWPAARSPSYPPVYSSTGAAALAPPECEFLVLRLAAVGGALLFFLAQQIADSATQIFGQHLHLGDGRRFPALNVIDEARSNAAFCASSRRFNVFLLAK